MCEADDEHEIAGWKLMIGQQYDILLVWYITDAGNQM